MSLSLRLDVRQSQSLVMTPQLQQAIKLLQLNNLELSAYVQQELDQNPFLEQVQERPDEPAIDPAQAPSSGDDGQSVLSGTPDFVTEESGGDGWSGSAEDGWKAAEQDPAPLGLSIDSLSSVGRGGATDFDDGDEGIEARATRPLTLRDHLTAQMHVDLPPGPDRLIAVHLIDMVDEAGYLRGSLEEVAGQLGCSMERVEATLKILQRFEPTGICARSLQECLALQLKELNRLDPAMEALLAHLDALARADFPTLLKVCGVGSEDLFEMIAEIKALNPRPGQGFVEERVDAAVPDIFISPLPNGWRVELNAATLPRLIVNNAYHTEIRKNAADQRIKDYASERYQSANWLVKALDQRARTVLRVAEAVVERQSDFLRYGVTHLKPLVLRDIAEAIDMHESTVSRATADRYVATPRGSFPFKYFFSNALPGTGGEEGHAAEAIRQQIKTLIDNEKPENILSDDQIVEELRAKGVSIARRTVAKYRESLAIPSSIQRKRAKALRLA